MALPYLDNPATLDDATVQELDGLVTKLNSFLGQEHNPQGGHTNITANSVVVDGPVTVRDEKLAPASFQRTVALGTQIAITPTPGGTTPWLTVIYDKVEDVRLGTISGGVYSGPGTRLGPALSAGGPAPQPWDVVTTSVGSGSAGPALVFGDPVRHDRPLVLMFDVGGGRYELRPNAAASEVWLGTPFGAANQFARAYLSDGVYQRSRSASMGDWQDVPYNAADFTTSSGGVWGVTAGNVLVRRYTLIGRTLHYHVAISNSNVGGAAPTELRVALPAGYTVSAFGVGTTLYQDNGATRTAGGYVSVVGDTFLRLQTIAGLSWTITAANNTTVFVTATCEVIG
jgi:hypothetical protein